MHKQHMTEASQHQANVEKHGDEAMGFPHDRTTHHFRLNSDGGAIEVTVNDSKDSHDAIVETARLEAIVPKDAHETFTAHQAVYLVSEHAGVAIFDEPPSIDCRLRGVSIRPLSDKSLCFDTCLVMRADQSSRAVNEFGRAFLKKYAPGHLPPRRMDLPLPA
jgi:hypothetical protein